MFDRGHPDFKYLFPLIQLPRKSEAVGCLYRACCFVVSINSTSEEVRSHPRFDPHGNVPFPLIQLPRKSEATMKN